MGSVYRSFYPNLMCSDVCKVFLMIVSAKGVKGRHVNLKRPSTDPIQGHSVCEIYLDKWICFDVAFNYCCGESVEKMYVEGHPKVIEDSSYYEEFKELYNNIDIKVDYKE